MFASARQHNALVTIIHVEKNYFESNMIQKGKSTLLQCFRKTFAADVARSKYLHVTSSNASFCTHYVDDVNQPRTWLSGKTLTSADGSGKYRSHSGNVIPCSPSRIKITNNNRNTIRLYANVNNTSLSSRIGRSTHTSIDWLQSPVTTYSFW